MLETILQRLQIYFRQRVIFVDLGTAGLLGEEMK
jgi:hypothetical protein